jgi:hypothetical protein
MSSGIARKECSEMLMKQGPQINIAASSGDVGGSERTCSGCTLCCSLLGIVELQKPVFKICKYCVIGKGCKIYDIKPATCTDFLCSYRISANVPEYWNPKICGMVLHKENNILSIICSNGAKHRWKQEPYWSDIKQAAAAMHVQRTGGVRIVRKDEPVLVINPETFEAQARGKLKGMESLPQWQRPDQNAGGKSL